MAKISLRAYHREIETLIDQGHHDEALAHCGYILKSYPKCLDTYRLMGKAYLDAHRYTEAEDIFKRLLLAVPDDFIGNLGISIIYDEQKSLNNAIWHMERAFEVQPSNTAVQGELRRLYGRRDGLEPPQIRLTRGALAQMYARGSQTQQAIAEIRSILAEEPDRLDMQILLARVAFRGGQKVEASDTCTALLKKYPYCLDANRIMVEVLADTSRSDSTQIYRHRVDALDPYSQFVPGSLFAVADVPDNAVTLEKLDLDEMEESSPAAAEFGSLAQTALALSFGTEAESSPSTQVMPGGEPAEPVAAPAEEIPDWLKAAGWGAATAEVVRRSEMQAHEENVAAEPAEGVTDELAAAEMPDWLKSMAPPEAAGPAEQPEALESAEADMDWLAGLGAPPAREAEPESEITHVGAGLTAAAVAAAAAMAHKDEAEKEPEGPAQAESQPELVGEDTPDWLKDTAVAASVPSPTSEAMPAPPSEALPDWMAEMGAEPSSPPVALGAVAAGMAMAAAHDDEPAEPAQPAGDETSQDLTTWLAGLDEQDQVDAAGQPAAASPAEMSEDDAFAWLESLAEKQGANPDELLTKPEDRPETPPEGLMQPEAAPAAPEEPASSELPPEELPAPAAETAAAQMSEDDAFAWLESLAAKQGANPDELLTKPEERSETTPDWLTQPEPEKPGMMDTVVAAATAAAVGAALSKEDDEKVEEAAAATAMADETAQPAGQAGPVESAALDSETEAVSVMGEETTQLAGQAEPMESAAVEGQPEAAGEDLSWLEGIDQEESAEEPEVEAPPLSEWVPAEPVAPEPELETAEGAEEAAPAPQMSEQQAPAVLEPAGDDEVQPAAEPEEMPDWLRASLEQTPEPPQGEEMPEWMITAAVLKAATPDEPETSELASEPEPVALSVPEPAAAEPMAAEPGPGIEVARYTPPGNDQAIFEQAQVDLQRGDLDQATAGYTKLIKRGRLLDEIISDLREATYRHPVDVIIWMTLGDAYKRASRLQEALDAYTKGEELLR